MQVITNTACIPHSKNVNSSLWPQRRGHKMQHWPWPHGFILVQFGLIFMLFHFTISAAKATDTATTGTGTCRLTMQPEPG